MSYETLLYNIAETGVATITLNQPDSRNALSNQMLDELRSALLAAQGDERVHCVVLTSSHPRVFSAGGDLGSFSGDATLIEKHFASMRFAELFSLLGQLGKPSLCAANGHVLAGGFGLALACDLIIAKDGVSFGTPEMNVGLFPFMVMALLFRNVPRKRATELLLLGERFSAEEAMKLGFVNRVVPEQQFQGLVEEWSLKLAAKSPLLMRLGKDALYRQQDMPFEDALDYLHSQLTHALSTEDVMEGVSAFFEKREPEWKGK